ncbi:hypothetical protein [Nostocoides sp.]
MKVADDHRLPHASAPCFVFGVCGRRSTGLQQSHRRTAASSPTGPAILFSGIVVVIFSMVGAEIATIAGAESDDPERGVTKADQLGRLAHLDSSSSARSSCSARHPAVELQRAGQVART